jgi:hypothetical protein
MKIKYITMLSVCASFSLATDNANAQAEDNPLSGLYAQAGIGYSDRADEDYVHFQLGIDKGNNSGWYISYKGGDDDSFDDDLLRGGPIDLGDGVILTGLDAEAYAITLGFIAGFPSGDNGSFFYGIGLGTGNAQITAKGTVDGTYARGSANEDFLVGELFFGLEHRFNDNFSLVGRVFAFYQSNWDITEQIGDSIAVVENDGNWSLGVDLGLKFTF